MMSITIWLCLCLAPLMAVKVVVIPQNINSHIMYHGRMARSLADESHVVGFLLPSNAKVPDILHNSSVEVIRYKVKSSVPFLSTEEASQMMVDAAMAQTMMEQIKAFKDMNEKMMPFFQDECLSLLHDEGIKRHMDEIDYDIAIMDNAGISCHITLPYKRNIPIILYGILSMEWMFRVPTMPSFVPSLLTRFTDQMTFAERLNNALTYLIGHIMIITFNNDVLPTTDPLVYSMEALEKCVFYFALDDMSIAYPRPLMPNTIYVGDIIPQPGKQLPVDINNFVNSAEHGVIIVSFGSFIDFMPRDVVGKFCEAFKRVPQGIIWKLKNKDLCQSGDSNMLLVDWIPQNDLLSHPNVKLFVSHCGINSVLESVYHSTPILGFPLTIDQPFNAERVQKRGFGYAMKIQDFSEAEIVEKMTDIINNETMIENVRRASRIMRNKPDTATKRVSYWVEHLTQHGTDHLRTNAVKLNMFQFYCFDVILTILLGIFLIIIIVYICTRSIFRCMRNCCCSKKAKID